MPLKVELRVFSFSTVLSSHLESVATEAMKEANKQTHKKRKLVEV